MISKLVVLQVRITELPMLVEQKSKQTALNDKPEWMSLPINDLSYLEVIVVCLFDLRFRLFIFVATRIDHNQTQIPKKLHKLNENMCLETKNIMLILLIV